MHRVLLQSAHLFLCILRVSLRSTLGACRICERGRLLIANMCKASDKSRVAFRSRMFSVFRKEPEVFMKAVELTSPADRVFLTKRGNHFKKIAQQSPDWSGQRERLLELQEQSQTHIRKLISLAAEERPEFSTHLG